MRTPVVWFLAAASLVASGAATAGEDDMRITVERPGTARLSSSGDAAAGARRVILDVVGYQPSASGPVTAVVLAECQEGAREIGRFGVFPDEAFAASAAVEPKRYGFELTEEPGCGDPRAVTIRLEPVLGDGAGASMVIAAVRIE